MSFWLSAIGYRLSARISGRELTADSRQPYIALDGVVPSTSTPFSRCTSVLARSAACGSCVTMTIVFSNSSFSRAQQVENLARALGVQVAGRLVGHQQQRIVDDRAGNRHALLLAAGELPRIVIHAVRQADDLQHGPHVLLPLALD